MMKCEVTTSRGEKLQAWLDPYYSPTGQPAPRLRIMRSTDDGATWETLPMRLSLASRLLKLWRSSHPHWPPRWVTQLGADSAVWFEYEDEWTHERTLFKPARWRAQYEPAKRHWRIVRLQHLPTAA